MRTTLEIDDDVLAAARSLAQVRNSSIGKVVSDLARSALFSEKEAPVRTQNGVPLFPRSTTDVSVTLRLVNNLRDDI